MFCTLSVSCSDKNSQTQKNDSQKSHDQDTINNKITENKGEIDNEVSDNEKPDEKKYAVSVYDTPVLYSPDFDKIYGGKDGQTLKFSKNGLVKELEYVAYPGSVFEIVDEIPKEGYSIYKVTSDEYDIVLGGTELYIDSRFVELKTNKPEKKAKIKPTLDQIYDYLDIAVGSDYVWGANNIKGVGKMIEFYPPSGKISTEKYNHWDMKGVDCSGLIYEATNGYTPRNTHQMVSYGEGIKIKGLNAEEITDILEPLDMIVWKGHVIYVYDKNTSIQSGHSEGGVVKKNLRATIEKLMQSRRPANEWSDNAGKIFVVRRWW